MIESIKYEDRTCGNCIVMNCEILNAIANTGTIRLVDFWCNRWEDTTIISTNLNYNTFIDDKGNTICHKRKEK